MLKDNTVRTAKSRNELRVSSQEEVGERQTERVIAAIDAGDFNEKLRFISMRMAHQEG